MLTATVGSMGVAVKAAPPTFAKDFYVGTQSDVALVQDGYYIDGGGCCSGSLSSGCKVQVISEGADYRESGTLNRTRSDGASGAVVMWYGKEMKQMGVVPGDEVNSTHKYACVGYCPLEQGDHFYPSLTIDPKAKDAGSQPITQPKSIGGKTKNCEKFSFTEGIGPIPMEHTDTFVDLSATPAAPWFSSVTIEPFGNKAGQENTSYIGYQAMDVSDYFDIDLDALDPNTGHKLCVMSDQCQPPPAPPSYGAHAQEHITAHAQRVLQERINKHTTSMYKVAQKKVAALKLPKKLSADPPPPPNVNFTKDFTATEDSDMVINQGGHALANGDICCVGDVPQCQIQYQHRHGLRYLDVTNQRTRFDDVVSGSVQVDDYTLHMSMLINVTNGVETCQEFCKIDAGDQLYPIDPFDPFDTVKDLGPDTFDGKPAHHYRWSDVILGVIKMQTTDFYANVDDPSNAIPIASLTDISPFGQEMGRQNQTWAGFKAGVPDASKFKIAGTATCPPSNQCQQSKFQANRLALRQLHTFAMYTPASNTQKAATVVA